MDDYKNKVKIQELIDKLDKIGAQRRVSVASNESMDIIFDEICVEQIDGKVVLFGLEGSEDF